MREKNQFEYKNLINNLIDLNDIYLDNYFNNIENSIEIDDNFKVIELLNKIMMKIY